MHLECKTFITMSCHLTVTYSNLNDAVLWAPSIQTIHYTYLQWLQSGKCSVSFSSFFTFLYWYILTSQMPVLLLTKISPHFINSVKQTQNTKLTGHNDYVYLKAFPIHDIHWTVLCDRFDEKLVRNAIPRALPPLLMAYVV